MAVYQGARLRHDALPVSERKPRSVARSASANAGHATRVRPMGLLMATIVAATMVGLVYLTQTLGANATSTEIYRLAEQRNKLNTLIGRIEGEVLELTQAEVVTPRARDQKLKGLGKPIVLRAP